MTIPTPSYERNANRLEDEYKKAYKSLLAEVIELGKMGDNEDVFQRQASLLRQIEVILSQLNDFNREWCQTEIRKAYTEGMAIAVLSSGGATTLTEATQGVQFSMLSQQTVEALINDTYNDLLQATGNTERRVKQLVRQTVGEVLRKRSIQQYGRVTIARDINKQLTKKAMEEKMLKDGFIGIIDKAGRKWSTTRYANMISTTKLNQAHVEGVRIGGIERGLDTAVISTHNAEDECRSFEGMIISMNGLTEGLLTYQELYDSNLIFHPNCSHKVHLIKIENLPKQVIEKHNQKVASLKHKNLKKKILPLDKIKVPDKDVVKSHNFLSV